MSAEIKKEIQLEIGHVLFIDIVGYSKLFITEQRDQLQTLKEIIRATEQSRIAEAEGKLLRLSTGDGGALVAGLSSQFKGDNRATKCPKRARPRGFEPLTF